MDIIMVHDEQRRIRIIEHLLMFRYVETSKLVVTVSKKQTLKHMICRLQFKNLKAVQRYKKRKYDVEHRAVSK